MCIRDSLLSDHAGMVRKIAGFIGVPVTDDDVERVVAATTFAQAKKNAIAMDAADPEGATAMFKGGQTSFIHKGTNGRWRGVLDDEDLALYAEAVERVLTPDCARWLERGGPAT